LPLYTKQECTAELDAALDILRVCECSREVSHAINIVVSEMQHRKSGAAWAGRVAGWWIGNAVGILGVLMIARALQAFKLI
jgi:hypothetical protein